MINGFLTWLAKFAANWLYERLKSEAKAALEEHKKAGERNETNAENLKKYNEAKDRADEIEAATNLLNGTRSPSV